MFRRIFTPTLLLIATLFAQNSALNAQQPIQLTDSTTAVPSKQYEASKRKEKWLGANYRQVWSTEVKVPILRLSEVYGGLKVSEEGGGMQTKSLQLTDSLGREFSLRSVEKYTEGILPEEFNETLAADVLQDQISASHPYAAVATARLADAVGVYHTNPIIAYVADDPALKGYEHFVGKLALFEERPDDEEWVGNEDFGNAPDIRSTEQTREDLRKNSKYYVDQDVLVRVRVFDMLIGDWDRHFDQWRFGEHEEEGPDGEERVRFEAIPRDRDNVFFINEGIVPNIASRRWIQPKFQGFELEIRDVEGLYFNARHFDREFINRADRSVWVKQARYIQENLTDTEIERAFAQWPPEVYRISAPEIIAKLKARRQDLVKYAEEYYEFLAKTIDVVGTNDAELFRLEQLTEDQSRLTVYDFDKDDNLKPAHYDRLIIHDETKEVRLYGMEEDDVFELVNSAPNENDFELTIRIIGGEGDDLVRDLTGGQARPYIYDTKSGNRYTGVPQARFILSDTDTTVNQYNNQDFKYNQTLPVVALQYNPDDGLFVGGGVYFKRQEFRKEPFAYGHRLAATYAFATGAYQLNYTFEANDILKYKYNFTLDALYRGSSFATNFFGIGNDTEIDLEGNDLNFYRVRQQELSLVPQLERPLGRHHLITLGSYYRMLEVENTPGRLINQFANENNEMESEGISANTFEQKHFGGGFLRYQWDTRDRQFLTTKGIRLEAQLESMKGLNNVSRDLTRFSGEFSVYQRLGKLPVVLSNRTGYAHNFQTADEYDFFQANYLDGQQNLRGYRRNRFGGDQMFFNNFEARIALFRFWSYIAPGQAGIIGFYDVGRVWVAGEDSNTWHSGYGPGIFIAPATLSFSLMYGISPEDNYPIARLGFFF